MPAIAGADHAGVIVINGSNLTRRVHVQRCLSNTTPDVESGYAHAVITQYALGKLGSGRNKAQVQSKLMGLERALPHFADHFATVREELGLEPSRLGLAGLPAGRPRATSSPGQRSYSYSAAVTAAAGAAAATDDVGLAVLRPPPPPYVGGECTCACQCGARSVSVSAAAGGEASAAASRAHSPSSPPQHAHAYGHEAPAYMRSSGLSVNHSSDGSL